MTTFSILDDGDPVFWSQSFMAATRSGDQVRKKVKIEIFTTITFSNITGYDCENSEKNP
jgi:hypothetical protein